MDSGDVTKRGTGEWDDMEWGKNERNDWRRDGRKEGFGEMLASTHDANI